VETRKGINTMALGCVLALGVTLFSGCAGGDTATVTIRIGNQMAKADMPSVVDRLSITFVAIAFIYVYLNIFILFL
jgi:hypothetical protein